MEKDIPTNDYAAKFLADLEAQHAALGNVIASLRAARSVGALGGMQVPGEVAGTPLAQAPPAPGAALPRGAFLGKKATEAIKLYLSAVRTKQTNKEIATALKDGGMESTGDFDAYITNGLFRLKQDGTLLRFDDGWALAEWYPESFRTRVAEKSTSGSTKKKKKPSARKRKAAKATTETPEDKHSTSGVAPKQGSQSIVEECFEANVGVELSAQEIADGLGIRIQTVSLICAKLAHKGRIAKLPNGKFLYSKVQQMPKAS